MGEVGGLLEASGHSASTSGVTRRAVRKARTSTLNVHRCPRVQSKPYCRRIDDGSRPSVTMRLVHVAGDATTMMQGAINAAADGTMTGAMINHALVLENIAAEPR